MREGSPHVAFWCPMPPASTGIAPYGFKLVNSLKEYLRISVVLPSSEIGRALVPDGVGLLSSEEALHGHVDQPDLHLYHVGNHSRFHGWMLEPITTQPGLVVLHDISLFDLYHGVCAESAVLWPKTIAHQGYDEALSRQIEVDGVLVPDRTVYTFTSEVVRPSLCTIVHSKWAVDRLTSLYPEARVVHVPLSASLLGDASWDTREAPSPGPTITILGGISHIKRVDIALRAFARAAVNRPDARLLLVGRADQPSLVAAFRSLIHDLGIEPQTRVLLDVSSEQFEQVLRESHLVVTLRWPTAGETSAVLMQALGAGRPVLTSDVPQFAEYDNRYVYKVLPGTPNEVESVAAFIRRAIDHPDECRRVGKEAREYVRSHATWEHAAQAYVRLVREYAQCPGFLPASAHPTTRGAETATSGDPSETPGLLGLNVHGDWAATSGLAHAGRRLCLGLLHRGVPLTIRTLSSQQPREPSLSPAEFAQLAHGPSRPIDLWTLNINEFHLVSDDALRSPRTRRHHIVTWYWEFPTIPEWLVSQIDRIDEIWAPSRFVQRALLRYTTKPTYLVPPIVPTFMASGERDELRSYFGLPRDVVVFLFTFDFNSTVGRKNPLGVVEAFTRAFPRQSTHSPTLVVKSINLEREPAFEKILREAVAQVGGVLLTSHLSEQDMADLFHASDIYVSLHRSEGFGFGMAEAMAIGKPVIGTGYSGNLDFMNVANSCLVGYQLRSITTAEQAHNSGMDVIYTEGTLWAEPDLDQAVEWMRLLAADEQLRNRIGEKAKQTIAEFFSEDAVSRIAVSRLASLETELRINRSSAAGIERDVPAYRPRPRVGTR